MERLHGAGIARRPPQPVRQLPIGALLQPLGASGGRLVEQTVQIDRGRGALLLGRPDGHGETFGRLQAEAHHRLVDRADVLDVQGPVRDALAVQHDELLQHPVDGAVGDQGRVDAFVDLPGAARSAALQEAIPVGVEEGAVAWRQPHRARPGAVVDHAEQGEELGVPAEALVHGIRVERRVFAQPFVEAGERVGAEEGLVLRQHVPLLGVEQEHEPQHDGEQAPVDLVGVLRKRLAQKLALRGVVSGLEAAQELVEGVQDLLGQAFADLVLVLAAVLEQGGEALRARHAQEPGLSEEQAHRGRDRPPRGGEHVRDAKVEPAGAFAPRRGDEPERSAVEEQSRRHAGVAQEAFHAPVGRGFEAAVRPRPAARHVVEVLARLADANEKLPGRCTVCRGAFTFGAMHRRRFERSRRAVTRCAFPHCGFGPRRGRPSHRVRPDREVGSKDLTPFREHRFEVGRDWRFFRARVAGGREIPTEHRGCEGAEVR